MTITKEQIESVAPDQASLNAASKLLKRSKWPMLEQSADGNVLWGQCQGSGSTPYSMAVAKHDLGAKCSCPSRKFPCKHSIALMWWFADNASEFTVGETPDWVSQWLSRRRGSTSTNSEEVSTKSKVSLSDAVDDSAKPVKPLTEDEIKKKADRAAKQKERNRQKRESSILQGLDDLDVWIVDQIEEGFAGFDTRANEQVQILVKRLVDAKAPGLAMRLESAVSSYFAAEFSDRNDVLIEAFGMLHLLANAYRRQAELPEPLVADVRQAVGWTVERESLLNDANAKRLNGRWVVTGTRETTQTDRTIRQETWLLCVDSEQEHTVAVLIDFVPVSSGAGRASPYQAGQIIDATVVFYPSATPLRALLFEPTVNGGAAAGMPNNPDTMETALNGFYAKRAANPWLASWPLTIGDVRVQRSSDNQLWLTNSDNSVAVLLSPMVAEKASVLLGMDKISVHGLFDGNEIELMAASTPLGAWWGTDL